MSLQSLAHLGRTPAYALWSAHHTTSKASAAATTCCGLLPALSRCWLYASAHLADGRRHASSTSYDNSGPSARLLSAVPFSVSRQEADAAFDAYHSTARSILLSKPAAGLQKVKEMYLPLWVARAQGDKQLTTIKQMHTNSCKQHAMLYLHGEQSGTCCIWSFCNGILPAT